MGPYQQLIASVRTRDGAEAEAHGRRHMDNLLLRGLESVRVRDVIGQDAPTKLGSSDASVAGAADCLARGHWIGQQILHLRHVGGVGPRSSPLPRDARPSRS